MLNNYALMSVFASSARAQGGSNAHGSVLEAKMPLSQISWIQKAL
jgi:hypothetical protein